jgi:hypothetical protein
MMGYRRRDRETHPVAVEGLPKDWHRWARLTPMSACGRSSRRWLPTAAFTKRSPV